MMVSKIPGGGYVERRLPKIGKFALLISLSQFFGILFNGLLGWFPAGIIGTGSRGQKFHLLQYIRQNLNLPYKSNGFWSDAGILTGQEFAMILLMLISLSIAVFGLKPRKEISGPSKLSIEEQQQQLETGQVSVSKPGGLSVVNPTTAAIVSSIVGDQNAPAADIIADALGEMSAVAMEIGVNDDLIKGQIIQEEIDDSIIDSRFTTKVGDQEDDLFDLSGTTSESTSELLGSTVVEDEDDDTLDWIDNSEITTQIDEDLVTNEPIIEPVSTPSKKHDLPKLPELSTKSEKSVTPSSEKTTPIVVPTTTPIIPKASSNDDSSSSNKVKDAHQGTMPRKPPGLPKQAIFDIELNSWTLFGRTIETSSMPKVVQSSHVNQKNDKIQQKTTSPPTIPTPPQKKGKKGPRLPNIPQI